MKKLTLLLSLFWISSQLFTAYEFEKRHERAPQTSFEKETGRIMATGENLKELSKQDLQRINENADKEQKAQEQIKARKDAATLDARKASEERLKADTERSKANAKEYLGKSADSKGGYNVESKSGVGSNKTLQKQSRASEVSKQKEAKLEKKRAKKRKTQLEAKKKKLQKQEKKLDTLQAKQKSTSNRTKKEALNKKIDAQKTKIDVTKLKIDKAAANTTPGKATPAKKPGIFSKIGSMFPSRRR